MIVGPRCYQQPAPGTRRVVRMRGKPNTPENFWSHVDKTGNCWVYIGARTDRGYGHVRYGGRDWKAHRLAWALIYGPIPPGLCVLHDCPGGDNPSCCRPDHLKLGTKADNTADMYAKGRQRTPGPNIHWTRRYPDRIKRGEASWSSNHPERLARGEINGSARLTAADVRTIRRLHAEGGSTLARLAGRFGVSFSNVSQIVNRQTWKHVN